jgi:hypothetical protein
MKFDLEPRIRRKPAARRARGEKPETRTNQKPKPGDLTLQICKATDTNGESRRGVRYQRFRGSRREGANDQSRLRGCVPGQIPYDNADYRADSGCWPVRGVIRSRSICGHKRVFRS